MVNQIKRVMKELSIEIPFGATDSELCNWEYTIPEGMEATIVDNKIVVKKKESEDEMIRRELIAEVKEQIDCIPAPDCRDKEDEKALKRLNKWLAWLENRGRHKPIDNDIKEALRTEHEKGRADVIAEMQKSAWSEEDEKIYNRIYDIVHSAAFSNYEVDEDGKECGEYAKITEWFKSLKYRYTWKPSKEQIAALTDAVNYWNKSGCYSSDLVQLLTDLKKLKE